MQHRRLGKTNLNVSVIGFGGIKLGRVSFDDASEAINRALDLGVNFIDTARNYRDSERKVGTAIKGRRDEVYVATKTESRGFQGAMKAIETSLRELDIDKIDLMQLHSVSDEESYQQVMSPDGALRALQKAQVQGMVDHVGVSIHRSHSVMRQAIESGEFETLMVAYSPLDQEGVEQEILPMAKAHDMGVITMKPLSGGLLASPNAEKKNEPQRDPIVFGSLWYVISNDAVSTAIPGIQTVREVEENVPAGDVAEKMSEQEHRKLMHEIGRLGIEFRYGQVCLRCGYCQPCPEGIVVPDVFKAYEMYTAYPDHLRGMGMDLYSSLPVSPEACVQCGECEERCPAHLPVRERLKMVTEAFARLSNDLR